VATPWRKQSGERRKQSTIGWPQRGAPLLPAEHHELMAQHEQLDVFSELAAPAPDQQPQHSREGEIGKRQEHEADAPIARYRVRDERRERRPGARRRPRAASETLRGFKIPVQGRAGRFALVLTLV